MTLIDMLSYLFISFIRLSLWLYWSLHLSGEVLCVNNLMLVGLCLTVTNLSSHLNSLGDLPENATSLLLGSLLHIEELLSIVYVWRREWKCASVQQEFSFLLPPTVKLNLWHQKQLHNYIYFSGTTTERQTDRKKGRNKQHKTVIY